MLRPLRVLEIEFGKFVVMSCNNRKSLFVVMDDGDDMYFAPHGSSLLPCNQHPLCPGGVGI